jgi:Phage integrase family
VHAALVGRSPATSGLSSTATSPRSAATRLSGGFDRARVIPIGDQLGRVIAEIIRHVRAFYGTATVPPCDRRDIHEKTPLPRAPYMLQGAGHPSVIGVNTIRGRLRQLSTTAQARRADGSPLVLEPHDCRRAFASEHLNNNTPVHVLAALLGHATLDTVMVYARLYPTTLVASYRQAMRGIYTDVHGAEALRTPTVEEWAAFSANCSMRDMGTHLCALPTGEHCPKGLVCLGCNHAQPKKSAAPTFRRMLASHTRALTRHTRSASPPDRSPPASWKSTESAAPYGAPRNCPATSPPLSRQPPPDGGFVRDYGTTRRQFRPVGPRGLGDGDACMVTARCADQAPTGRQTH